MLHGYLEDELFNNKSLGALIYLVGKGREFEFYYKGVLCFISRAETKKAVSLWINETEYAFDDFEGLTAAKVFDNRSLLDVWKDIEIKTLF